MTTKEKYKKVAYYPGCALEGSGHSYNRSTKAVGKALGLDLVEVDNWNCCGAMEVKNVDPKLQTYLSSRVMSTAANEMDMDVVMAPCNGCYHNLKKAEYDLKHDQESVEVVDRLSKKAGHKTYESGQVETIHALDWIRDSIGEEGLAERPITMAACTRGRATSSRKKTRGPDPSRHPSPILWTICWRRLVQRTLISRSKLLVAAVRIRCQTVTSRPSSS
jgi:heterodisulfide reductase subunit B